MIAFLKKYRRVIGASALFTFFGISAAHAEHGVEVKTVHVDRLPNSHNPELLYWFFSPDELVNQKYLKDLDIIAKSGTFTTIFLTARDGMNFHDVEKMKPVFTDLVKHAHERGLKIGIHASSNYDTNSDHAQQLVGMASENESILDAKGHAEFTGTAHGVRVKKNDAGEMKPLVRAVRTELLAAYAFKPSGEGTYVPGSVVDVTSKAHVLNSDKESVHVAVDDPEQAGKSLYALTVTYYATPDLFSPWAQEDLTGFLKAYQSVGFDGAALDEFRHITVGHLPGGSFRERIYSPHMATYYQGKTGEGLTRTLFDMRYAPQGDVAVRLRAINHYFDVLRDGTLNVEKAFYKATAETMGPDAFHGIHNTFHNRLDNDEIWATSINWWANPRDYGQTDEVNPMGTRLGIGMARPKPVEFNQYYTFDEHRFLQEGIDDARYNIRVHYHAFNDLHPWGEDIRTPSLLSGIGSVEDKVRLLNAFDAPRPQLNVLYLFGYPSLLNWLQPGATRNEWDINGSLHAEEKAAAGWNAGYLGPLAPTYLIDDGHITVDDHGGLLFGGERFTAVVMMGPEFSKPSTMKLLEKFVAGGGKLLFDGTQHHDFEGKDVSAQFNALASKSVGTEFSTAVLDKLGVPKLLMPDAARYTDGSVVFTDLESLLHHTPKSFSIDLSGHTFRGSYEGLLAIKVDEQGNVQKLAAGGFESLLRDGKPVVTASKKTDLVLLRNAPRKYDATVVGDAKVNVQ